MSVRTSTRLTSAACLLVTSMTSGCCDDPGATIPVPVGAPVDESEGVDTLAGMVWVPPGEFTMGSDAENARRDEKPAHRVSTPGFWIDATEVTNSQFRRFVEATGYVTTAEKVPDWEELRKQVVPGTTRPANDVMVPGSLVFTPPTRTVNLADATEWWSWTPGASWRSPEGPGSSIVGRDDHPVLHVSWFDAREYAKWARKRLPTEAEWERAARRGRNGATYIWGEDLEPAGRHMANIWQGIFPHRNTKKDGFASVAPVGSFPPNALGLYDMAGNVWEWTADRFHPEAYAQRLALVEPGGCCANPAGPTTTYDPRHQHAPESRVLKGGSFLCHASYCSSYRPSAKMATSPDTGMSHVGFRCVSDALLPEER